MSREIADILSTREALYLRQRTLARRRGLVVCAGVNIPSCIEEIPEPAAVSGGRPAPSRKLMIEEAAEAARWHMPELELCFLDSEAGVALLSPQDDGAPHDAEELERTASRLKERLMETEEHHPLGRLMDLDVLYLAGGKLRRIGRTGLGRPPRKCFLCPRAALECRRERRHAPSELAAYVRAKAGAWTRWTRLYTAVRERTPSLAWKALMYEALLHPKPGLVTRRDSGRHIDMDVYTFTSSAAVVAPGLAEALDTGVRWRLCGATRPDDELAERLKRLGLLLETRMLEETGGVNTHKGAIFSLGLALCSFGAALAQECASSASAPEADAAAAGGDASDTARRLLRAAHEWCIEIGSVFEKELEDIRTPSTYGERAFLSYGEGGARREAGKGLPAAFACAERLLFATEGRPSAESLEPVLATALVRACIEVEDSSMLVKGGWRLCETFRERSEAAWRRLAGLGAPGARREARGRGHGTQAEAAAVMEIIERWHSECGPLCLEYDASPGGAADMVAAGSLLASLAELAARILEEERRRRE